VSAYVVSRVSIHRDLRELRWSAAEAVIILADGVEPDVAAGFTR
jgi:hypothetical protein